jgi:DNA-binding MarR family transcriptional regulator
LQVKYRRVRKGSQVAASIAEVHILVEIDAGKALTVNQLSEALLLAQSHVSRLLQNLRTKKLITQRVNKTDSRQVLSSLTSEGKNLITRIDLVMGAIFNSSAQSLSLKEQSLLTKFFKAVALGHGCKTIRARINESKLRATHRQMARIFGFLSNNIYESGKTRAQWNTLEAIITAPKTIHAGILEGYLGIKSPLLCEILNSFEAHGYIEKARSPDNHRINLLYPTALGRKHFRDLETKAVLKLKNSLNDYSTNKLKDICNILKKFAGEWGKDSIFLGQSLQTKEIETKIDLQNARAFCLKNIVAKGWEYEAPDPLFPSAHQIWELCDKSDNSSPLKAVCVAKIEKKQWIVYFGIWDESISSDQFYAFIQYAHYLSDHGKPRNEFIIQYQKLKNITK